MSKVNLAINATNNTRLFALQEKMILEDNLSFFKEYEALIEKWEGTAGPKKAMKFISKLSTGTQTINLVEFYKTGNKKQPLYFWPNFQTILNEATENGDVPNVDIDETFYQHQNTESITDNNAMAGLKESIIDLGTAEGRLEARKRLGVLAYFLRQQPKAEKGDLLIIGYANVIGWFKTKSGSVFSAARTGTLALRGGTAVTTFSAVSGMQGLGSGLAMGKLNTFARIYFDTLYLGSFDPWHKVSFLL